MKYDLLLHSDIENEIAEAFEWYLNISEELALDFLQKIDECYAHLIKQPDFYSFITNKYRRINLNRFPYVVIYEIVDNCIYVLHIRHEKQKLLL